MFLNFYYIFGLIFLVILYFCYFNYEYFKKVYNKWVKLNNVISLKYKSPIIINIVSFYIIIKYMYYYIIQYLTSNVKKIDKNTYEITYIISGKIYKMRVKTKRGPSIYEKIENEKGEDVTHLLSFFGPHIVKLSPLTFNQEKMIFYTIYDEIKTFEKNDIIDI